ncbi:MAG: molybdopterin-dependent oxidoreductase [Candidatus Methanomethylicia archaeon]
MIVDSVCSRDCYDTCFMKVYVENNIIREVKGSFENPITEGILCPRGYADPKRTHSVSRILYPYLRTGEKPSKLFKRISWDYGLNLIVEKLRNTIENYGSKAVLHINYAGNMGVLTWYMPQRLWYALGASRTDYSICSKSGREALKMHYGLSYGVLPDELVNMKLTIYWGFNAAVSAPHLLLKTLRSKSKIIVVDPRLSETAANANLWIQPKPGSDVALAYGVAKYLIEKNHIDHEFIDKYTYGYQYFKNEVLKWSEEEIEETTGVPWSIIREFGEIYGSLKPSVIMIGIGLQKSIHGWEAVRAVSLLPALIGIHRGFYYTNSDGWSVDLPYLTGEKLTHRKPYTVSQVALGRLLERGKFKFIWIHNMNPLASLPNQQAVRRGLARNDVFTVVHETHWSETTEYADIVLPAPTFLEKKDLVIPYSHNYVKLYRNVLEPLGESRDELWVTRKLSEKLNLREWWLYEDPLNALKKALINAFENEEIKNLFRGETLKLKAKPKEIYQTPTGKIEIYSTKAEKYNISPIPMQKPIPTKRGYLTLITSAYSKYTHSQFQDVYGAIPATVWINPEDAEKHGVKDQKLVKLCNDKGEVILKAIVTNKVLKGTLWSPRLCIGVNGKPQNTITSDKPQILGGGSSFNSTLVRMEPYS